MKLNGNLSEREILLLINQSLDDLKMEVSDMRETMATTYATKHSVTSIYDSLKDYATRTEMEVLKEQLKPYLSSWAHIAKTVLVACVASVMSIIGYNTL